MSDTATKTILIVEDDEFLRSLTAKRLEKESYHIVIAADGEQALTTLGAEKPDLVLLDLLLPGTNGFQVLEKMDKKMPVVVFSNLGQKEDIEKAKGLGADDFLIKANFTLDDVVAKVNEYLKK
ncbi:MAG: two-component system, OmpR family, response regulator PfeR [Patescibacteria group bacterium]|nr:two-component system, OmpR family, response regulator PfeR [Patescibacteria group bacterium]